MPSLPSQQHHMTSLSLVQSLTKAIQTWRGTMEERRPQLVKRHYEIMRELENELAATLLPGSEPFAKECSVLDSNFLGEEHEESHSQGKEVQLLLPTSVAN